MIDERAIIDRQAFIGKNVEIGPFAIIKGAITIKDGCRIEASAHILGNTIIGENSHIHSFAVIGGEPQDRSYQVGTDSSTIIGKNCIIREGVTIHRGTAPGSKTVVGDGVYLMVYSHVGHNAIVGNNVTIANSTHLGGFVEVQEGANISGNISVHQYARIGKLAMVSASSFVNRDIPPYCIAQKIPARVAGLNSVGLKRAGYSVNSIKEIKRAFKIFYFHKGSRQEKMKLLRAEGNLYAQEYIDFINSSVRGIGSFGRRKG